MHDISIDNNIGMSLINLISKAFNLEKLTINMNNLKNDFIKELFVVLEKKPNSFIELGLDNIDLNSEAKLDSIKFLENQTYLTILILSYNKLGNDLARTIFKSLAKSCFSLVDLRLHEVDIDDGIGSSIIEFIGQQKNLTILDLACNSLKNDILRGIFERLVNYPPSFTELWLFQTDFDHNIGSVIVDFIGKQYKLVKLDIGSNRIGNELARGIFSRLAKKCFCLEELYVRHLGMTSEVGDCLAEFIGQQKNLMILGLRSNHIGVHLVKSIFERLAKHCYTIEGLGVYEAGTTEEIGMSIADFIGQQCNITVLQISSNQIGNHLARALLENGKKLFFTCKDLDVKHKY